MDPNSRGLLMLKAVRANKNEEYVGNSTMLLDTNINTNILESTSIYEIEFPLPDVVVPDVYVEENYKPNSADLIGEYVEILCEADNTIEEKNPSVKAQSNETEFKETNYSCADKQEEAEYLDYSSILDYHDVSHENDADRSSKYDEDPNYELESETSSTNDSSNDNEREAVINIVVENQQHMSDSSDSPEESVARDLSKCSRNKIKEQRMLGVEYRGYRRPKSKIVYNDAMRPARVQASTCISRYCAKSKLRHCSVFDNEQRKDLFDSFWQMNWEQKRLYTVGLVSKTSIGRSRLQADTSLTSHKNTIQYHLKSRDGKPVQVCRSMFLGTLGLKEKMVREWLNKNKEFGLRDSPYSIAQKRKLLDKSTDKFKNIEARKAHLNKFLDDFPKLESHYCRKDSSKLYFQTTHTCKRDLYRDYVCKCGDDDVMALSEKIFNSTLQSLNFSIFKPRKDQCDTCVEYQAGNLEEAVYQEHRKNVEYAREESSLDASKSNTKLLCMDVQAVKLCPMLETSAAYYKMKLQIHNFTIYDIITHESTNYVWDETEGQLVASIFTSIIITHLEKVILENGKLDIVIWSDGCGYQNRNAVLSNALSGLAVKHQITIVQKYLEKGHTQMQCDSTHSLIERKIKGKKVHIPSNFVSLVEEARTKPKKLDVVHLSHGFFLNYDSKNLRYNSIRPGKCFFLFILFLFKFLKKNYITGKFPHDPTVSNLKCLRYSLDGQIYFKLHFKDDFTLLPHRPRDVIFFVPEKLYVGRQPITEKKYKHLQELKVFLPYDTHSFYDALPYQVDKTKMDQTKLKPNAPKNK